MKLHVARSIHESVALEPKSGSHLEVVVQSLPSTSVVIRGARPVGGKRMKVRALVGHVVRRPSETRSIAIVGWNGNSSLPPYGRAL